MPETPQPTIGADMVPLRNPQTGPTVFSDENQRLAIHWASAGEAGDVQMVPKTLLQHPALAEMVMKGVLLIDDRSEAIEAVQRSADAWLAQQQAANQASVNVLDRSTADEMVMVPCIGPGSRPGASCNENTSVRQSQMGKMAPLCSRHDSLRASFVPVAGDDPNTVQWVMAQATARQSELV